MRELIFFGLLASVNGLGDTFPYRNTRGHYYSLGAQIGAGDWVLYTCSEGTKQSPIDVISHDAIPKSHPHLIHGYDYDATVNWQINGRIATAASVTSVNFSPKLADSAISGGPLPTGAR